MKEFTKHIITALKDDDWELGGRSIRHIKSRLIIDVDRVELSGLPYAFSWWERKVVAYHIRQMQQRLFTAKFIEYRLHPKPPAKYSHDDHFF
jgi:hypothetical protein